MRVARARGLTFGHDLIRYCRSEILDSIGHETEEVKLAVESALDNALHNITDLLEGFWCFKSGPGHRLEYSLAVRVVDNSGTNVEQVEISPGKLDLRIGYWKWRDGEFR